MDHDLVSTALPSARREAPKIQAPADRKHRQEIMMHNI